MTRYWLTFLFACALVSGAVAQTGTTVPTYPLVSPPVPSPSDVHARWRGGANVVSWWLNGFGQQQARNDIKRAVEAAIAAQKPFLTWTGQGVLLNARVIVKGAPNSPLRAWAVLGDGALAIGRGKTPEEALLASWRRSTIEAGVPDGWALDKTMSTYLWVQLTPSGSVKVEGVPRGTMLDLDKRVRDNWAYMEVRRFESELDNLDAWKRVATTAKKRIADNATKRQIDATLKSISDSHARVLDINTRLKTALDRAESAAESARLIATLQGVLSVAQLTQMAVDAFQVPSSEFSGVSTGVGVASKVESYHKERVQFAAELKVAFDGSVKDLQTFLDNMIVQIAPANPPPGVRDTLQVVP